MIYPLVRKEEVELKKAIKELENAKQELVTPSCIIQIHRSQIEAWLNILKMAQLSNEQLTQDWQNDKIGGLTGVKSAPCHNG